MPFIKQTERPAGRPPVEIELPLAQVLLTPLRWLEQKRPDFYRNYAEPVLARSEGRSEQCT